MKPIKEWPLSVKVACIILTLLVVSGVVLMPGTFVPLLILFAGVASLLRIMVYFFHGQ